MIKRIMIGLILVVVGIVVIGSPIEPNDNPQTITKKAINNYQMNMIEETTTTVTKQLGDQAIESSCKNPASQSCWTSQWYVFASSLALAILFAGLFVTGLIFAIRFFMDFIQ